MNYICFANKLSSWILITFYKNFCDHYIVNTQFIFYFLIICYVIHVKLIYFNFHCIETIIYRVICNEMFVANFWFIFVCLNFVKMFYNDIIFCIFWFVRMLKYNEMSFNACFVIRFLSYVLIRTKCFDIRFIFRFRLVALHEKYILNFDEMFCLFAIDACFVIWFNVFRCLFTCSNSDEMF